MISMLLSLRGLKSIYFFHSCAMSISCPDFLLFGEQRKDQQTRAIFPQPLLISLRAKKTPGNEDEDAFESQQFEISSDMKFLMFDFSGFQLNRDR